jgi:hypothetical protein
VLFEQQWLGGTICHKKEMKKRRMKMMKQKKTIRKAYRTIAVGTVIFVLGAPVLAGAAGVTVYKEDDKYVKMGGRIQVQYHYQDPDGGDSTDELFFRRLRPYIEGSIHKDWKGKFQFDLGKAEDDNEVAIKDAYLQYKGFGNTHVTLGNANFPFSRELLTSSKYQQLVERTFVGDHNYGTPDRNLGLHLTGDLMDKKLTWGASFTSASIDPDAKKLDFDTPVNRNDDFNDGWMYGGRIDFHPMGNVKFSQGDFERDKFKAVIGAAIFGWSNDDDNNTHTDENGISASESKFDMDSVVGFEISGGLRGAGFSVDAEYNIFNAETVDPTATGGMYLDGETDLKNFAVEGGYMIIADKLELVAGWQTMDADNYAEKWNRTSFGVNYFFKKQDIKLQLTYRMGENLDGKKDHDENELFLQAQYVF